MVTPVWGCCCCWRGFMGNLLLTITRRWHCTCTAYYIALLLLSIITLLQDHGLQLEVGSLCALLLVVTTNNEGRTGTVQSSAANVTKSHGIQKKVVRRSKLTDHKRVVLEPHLVGVDASRGWQELYRIGWAKRAGERVRRVIRVAGETMMRSLCRYCSLLCCWPFKDVPS